MPPELPPEVISVNLIVCERVLLEKDRVASAIRIVDIFYVGEAVSALPKEIKGVAQAHVLLVVKARQSPTQHSISMRLTKPDGTEENLGQQATTDFSPKVEGAEIGGFTVIVGLNIHVGSSESLGTYYICAYIDDKEATRAPITLLRPPPSEKPAD